MFDKYIDFFMTVENNQIEDLTNLNWTFMPLFIGEKWKVKDSFQRQEKIDPSIG